MSEVVHDGFTREQLDAAFNLIKPEKGWKFPIDAQISRETDAETLVAINASIDFYVGGQAKFIVHADYIRVTAPGYYNLIGA